MQYPVYPLDTLAETLGARAEAQHSRLILFALLELWVLLERLGPTLFENSLGAQRAGERRALFRQEDGMPGKDVDLRDGWRERGIRGNKRRKERGRDEGDPG